MEQDKGASFQDRATAASQSNPQAVSSGAGIPSATPEHIITDIGQKFAEDVTASALRNFQLVDDAKAAFVVGTFGAAAALGLTAAAYVNASGGKGEAKEMIDALLLFIKPMAIDTAAQAIEARRAETGTGSVHESAVGPADAPESPSHD